MERIRGIIVKTLTILAGFWIADLAAARVQAGIAAGESVERIMDGMTTMLQHPTALGFDRNSLLCGLGGACAVGLFHLYRWSMRRNWRDGEEYGSARCLMKNCSDILMYHSQLQKRFPTLHSRAMILVFTKQIIVEFIMMGILLSSEILVERRT